MKKDSRFFLGHTSLAKGVCKNSVPAPWMSSRLRASEPEN